ncbi:hypothetical protein XENOCAPTIV_006755 [Xenoophorus captivus]|uniref:Uncharacterized protein n=1 Tax=Xenoophorus captivus TaxID=1517983 RepID=A0ABV0QI10_9TELE
MNSAYSNALDALGEVVVKKLTQDQLKSKDAIRSRFQMELRPFLASPSTNFLSCLGTYNFSCQTYQLVVSGMAKVVSAIPQQRLQEIADVLLEYLQDSAAVINQPDCRTGIKSDAQWIETNLGPFSEYITYSELKFFNLSLAQSVNYTQEVKSAFLLAVFDRGGLPAVAPLKCRGPRVSPSRSCKSFSHVVISLTKGSMKLHFHNFLSHRVSFMGNNFTYTSSEFGRQDVYITIRSYLRAESMENISASEVLSASKNPTLVSNMLKAPNIIQEIFVRKIISADPSPAKVVQNVPDSLATQIPPSMLVFTEGTADITAFPTRVPDQEVKMLASVSRTATLEDISKWNISKLDTLAALMKPEDGTWEKAKVQQTDATTTSGVLELTRSPASVLLAALFTAVLQVLLQPA